MNIDIIWIIAVARLYALSYRISDKYTQVTGPDETSNAQINTIIIAISN